MKVIHISLAETLTKSNYQDMQRFMPVDLAIFGDAESSLPALTEAVKAAITIDARAAPSPTAPTNCAKITSACANERALPRARVGARHR